MLAGQLYFYFATALSEARTDVVTEGVTHPRPADRGDRTKKGELNKRPVDRLILRGIRMRHRSGLGTHQNFSRIAASALVLVAATAPAGAAEDESSALSEVTVTGSRFGERMAVDSPTPIDSISVEELTRSGASDLQGMLKVAVPSFSTPRPTAAGALDFLTPPTLRGLSTGQLLLLVNGKRRHTSSVLNTGNQVGRGDVAYDFNAIPAAAVKRVEVLRDGAAAQYGSDAIAGVMNVVLDDSVGVTLQGKAGETSEHDGEHIEASAGAGFALGQGGVVRFTAQYQHHDETNRALPDTRQQYFGSNGTRAPSANYGSGTGLTPASGTLDPREATIDRNVFVSGEPAYEMGSAFVNLELPVSEHATLYSFGGYSRLDGTSFNFFRRAGQDETVRALWPDGYLPLQDIELQNVSAAAGIRGDGLAGLHWDFSSVYGASIDDLGYDDSNNVSFGTASPLSFDRGGSRFKQWTTNLDLSRGFDLGASSPLNVAFGLEYRKEFYKLVAGDPFSYTNGGVPILDGPNAGRPAPVGGQPSGGLSPAEALSVNRDSKAAYAEVEQELFGRLLLSGAVRTENYSDFGDTTDYKAAARIQVVDSVALRGSFGTGFRAPNLAQSYNTSSGISFVNGAPLKIRQIGVNDLIAPLVGASALKPETSKNLSLGVVFNTHALTATLDVYRIEVQDRIALSSNFQSTALTNLLAANGFPGIAAVSYETNAVDTTTKGVDLTMTYAHDFGSVGRLNATLAGNYNESDFDRIAGTPAALAGLGITAPLFDLTQQVRFTNSMPKDKVSLNLSWTYSRFTVSLTNTRYGEVAQVSLTGRTPAQVAALIPGYDVKLVPTAAGSANSDIIQYFGADIVTDLDVKFQLNEKITLSAGSSNLFDQYPDKQIASTAASVAAGTNGADNTGTLPYAYIAPYGFSGRFYYLKSVFKF